MKSIGKIKKIKNLIIGAGISGLSIAYFLKDDNYLILEKDNRVGGFCKTTVIGDFVWDYSGHFFHFKKEEWKKFFIDAIGESNCLSVKKNTKIFINQKLIDYPFQSNIHQLSKNDFASCVSDLYFSNNAEGTSFLEMIQNRYGKSICELFLKPYNEKLYSCDLNLLDKNAMGRFFPKINKDDIFASISGKSVKTYNDCFLYPRMGCQQLINYFIKKVKKINLNEIVLEIDVENKIVKTNKGLYLFENLINTAPLNAIYDLFRPNNNSKILFSFNKVKVFNIGFNKTLSSASMYSNVHWVYFPEKKYCFYRVGFYNYINPINKLSLYVEIGYSSSEDCSKVTFDNVIDDLKRASIIDDSFEKETYEEIVMNPAYVHIEEVSSKQIDTFINNCRDSNIYFLGRYGKWIYCSIEDCLDESKNLAEFINQKENK